MSQSKREKAGRTIVRGLFRITRLTFKATVGTVVQVGKGAVLETYDEIAPKARTALSKLNGVLSDEEPAPPIKTLTSTNPEIPSSEEMQEEV